MKTASGPLLALLASGQFFKADLYTITLIDGTVLRTTDADVDLTVGGNSFPSCAPIITRTKVRTVIGVVVDTMTLTVMPLAGQTLGGYAWPQAVRLGLLDGATVLVETAYLSAWPTVVDKLHVFQGPVSDVMPSRSGIAVTVKSALEYLNQPFPRNVYQIPCLHTVYDAGCGLAKATYTFTGSAAAGATTSALGSALTNPAGYFDQGVLTFTGGALAGLQRVVKSYDGAGGFTFTLPLPSAPATGDAFSVFAGCDKTRATCSAKFGNLTQFRGFPFIPTPETTF